eukprot:SAG22_NODE_20427_length_265_cov_54.951807_1_plen_45_part_10
MSTEALKKHYARTRAPNSSESTRGRPLQPAVQHEMRWAGIDMTDV